MNSNKNYSHYVKKNYIYNEISQRNSVTSIVLLQFFFLNLLIIFFLKMIIRYKKNWVNEMERSSYWFILENDIAKYFYAYVFECIALQWLHDIAMIDVEK